MRAEQFWGFPFYSPALLGISNLTPGTMGISILPPAGRKKVSSLSNASTAIENQTFNAGVTASHDNI